MAMQGTSKQRELPEQMYCSWEHFAWVFSFELGNKKSLGALPHPLFVLAYPWAMPVVR